MFKLTVLYNLPEGADHEAFLKWRTTQGQKENAESPGVLKTDFYVAKETEMGAPVYRYITEAYFATMEDLQASFFSDEAQAKLKEDMKMMGEAVFLVSEELVSSERA
jgi:hypothetical protein